MGVHVRTRFDGRVFVPEAPLDLPIGATLEGTAWGPGAVEDAEVLNPEKPLGSQEEWIAFLEGIAGSWVGAEMEDPEDSLLEEPNL